MSDREKHLAALDAMESLEQSNELLSSEKRLAIHKKDGERHSDELLWSKEKLSELNPDDWVPLCSKHHRYVHWAMDNLGFSWRDLSETFEREDDYS